MNRFVTIAEAAKALEVSEKTVRRYKGHPATLWEERKAPRPQGGASRQWVVELSSLARALGRDVQAGDALINQPGHQMSKLAENGPEQGEAGSETAQADFSNLHTWDVQPGGNVQAGVQAGILPSESGLLPLDKSEKLFSIHATSSLARPGANVQAGELEPGLNLRNPEAIPAHQRQRVQQVLEWLQPLHAELQQLGYGARAQRVRAEAARRGMSERHIWRLLGKLSQARDVVSDLARKRRADSGAPRLPQELLRLVMTLWIMHPRYSARRIRRIIELNDPALLRYKPYPRARATNTLSPGTIQRVRQQMERIPAFRVALMDDRGKKEFGRVWVGEVLAERANELWMVDMTRCDTFVYDPYSDKILRLRIHAAIDVFSGAVPAFVFSREEGQAPTDRMLMLGLLEKPDRWAQLWPIWGRPEVIYWDNGKVYRSEKSAQIARTLGIRLEHSLPRVSHSRGNIERFFGVFHNTFERGLPGYAGSDTTERDHQQIARLLHNTRRWVAEGGPDPRDTNDRLLTEDEFKQAALAWLTMDYHREIRKGGKSYQELFLETAPPESRARFNFGDLSLVFSRQERRKVRGNGTVVYEGRAWGLADGSLIAHQGDEVVLLVNDLMPAQNLVAALPVGDRLQVLGPLAPMDFAATSDEAREMRRRIKAQAKSILEAAEEVRRQFTDPTYRHDRVLERLAGAPELAKPEPQTFHLAAPEARLEADPEAQSRTEMQSALEDFLAEGFVLDEEYDLGNDPLSPNGL
jgi:putative transposase